MYGFTHAVFGLALCRVLRVPVVTGVVAAGMPDVDTLFSFGYPFGHRGALHTPIAAVFVGLLVFAWTGRRSSGAAAFAGWMSHLFLDTLTPSGILWLFPVRARFSLDVALAASLEANLAIMAVSFAVFKLWVERMRWLQWIPR
ncbi:MAG: metal-dependent hydrolase [Candidatus Nanohaloarchaea archaeon]|nr:metal-dependent hydrolase [Candidatus Nanohaloarchaea archaeon]